MKPSSTTNDRQQTMTNRLGITGTRHGGTPEQLTALRELLASMDPGELRHGDCIGVDVQAAEIATELGWTTIAHPPTDPKARAWHTSTRVLPKKPYLDRNRDIVTRSLALIAVPDRNIDPAKPWQPGDGGTAYTAHYAFTNSSPIHLLYPSGEHLYIPELELGLR
jgi:hypothetical protein